MLPCSPAPLLPCAKTAPQLAQNLSPTPTAVPHWGQKRPCPFWRRSRTAASMAWAEGVAAVASSSAMIWAAWWRRWLRSAVWSSGITLPVSTSKSMAWIWASNASCWASKICRSDWRGGRGAGSKNGRAMNNPTSRSRAREKRMEPVVMGRRGGDRGLRDRDRGSRGCLADEGFLYLYLSSLSLLIGRRRLEFMALIIGADLLEGGDGHLEHVVVRFPRG